MWRSERRSAWARGRQVTSLIEHFYYPQLGPGMMWEACAERATTLGTTLLLEHPVHRIGHGRGRAHVVTAGDGMDAACSDVVSTMPLGALVAAMDPAPPAAVLDAAGRAPPS